MSVRPDAPGRCPFLSVSVRVSEAEIDFEKRRAAAARQAAYRRCSARDHDAGDPRPKPGTRCCGCAPMPQELLCGWIRCPKCSGCSSIPRARLDRCAPEDAAAEGGKTPVPTLYDVSGSAHWANKPDLGIVVHRPDPVQEPTRADIYIRKVRFKSVGKIGVASLQHDPATGRYSELRPKPSYVPPRAYRE